MEIVRAKKCECKFKMVLNPNFFVHTHRVVVHVARGCKAKQDLRTYFLLHSNVHILHIKYTIQKDNTTLEIAKTYLKRLAGFV